MKQIIKDKLQALMLILLLIAMLPLTTLPFIIGFLKQFVCDSYELGIKCCDKFINYIDEL